MSENLRKVKLAKETLRVFTEHGEDMPDVRHVVHYFYGGDFEALANSLRELGYATRATVQNDGVVAERHEAIGEEWRTTTLVALCELADSHGVEYDGWEASMERQQTTETEAARAPKAGGWLAKIFGKKN